MRGQQLSREKMEGLEDEVESLAQELEEKKREENKRLKKVATLQKEIQVYALRRFLPLLSATKLKKISATTLKNNASLSATKLKRIGRGCNFRFKDE